ncbi:RNA_binding putative [Hexamita inflata]|uniref:RNA binding putative n=1 Tax=Hexamita inflata TaxID=28002 RepID=A0AA86PHV7_9EUKA|nr:RNA binding putative [Hexamita inflata]CAI9938691.1 RNA binding putative [Hexamita inflata]
MQKAVLRISNLPNTFAEAPMKKFFNQFGRVLHTKIWRSQRTGNSCGFGFVQFEDLEVAKVVNQMMNGYLLFGKILKSEFVKDAQENLFKDQVIGENKQVFMQKINRPYSEEEFTAEMEKVKKIYAEKQEKLTKAGIEYQIPDVIAVDLE